MRLFGILIMSCAGLYAGAAAGGPAVYTVGNLHGISPGTEGSVSLEGRKLVFRAGKSVTAVSYADIMDTELGAKTAPATDAPLYKVWKLPKRINPDRVLHQMLTIEFADKAGNAQTMTFEMEEPAAAATLEQIEIRQGKRHRVKNGDPWWGDSLWKTPRNNNTVEPEAIGNTPVK